MRDVRFDAYIPSSQANSPRLLKLAWLLIFLVISIPSREGLGLPEGWLCANPREHGFLTIASPNKPIR